MIKDTADLAYGQPIVRMAAKKHIGIMLFKGPMRSDIIPHAMRPKHNPLLDSCIESILRFTYLLQKRHWRLRQDKMLNVAKYHKNLHLTRCRHRPISIFPSLRLLKIENRQTCM